MNYFGTRLSENISRREPEGYLLCLNVPVARSGTQDYLPEELGLPPGPGLIPVLRPEQEVFSPEAVASFEGMPVTNDHPPDGVDAGNIRALQKGHAHNVRRGTEKESDLLLADLIITDPVLIEAILREGKREISCGYTYELAEENGQYIQRNIRGNHVAVVEAGRAGPRVCIRDEHPVIERRNKAMKKSLSKVLARMAKDGDVETVAEILEEMIEAPDTEEPAAGETAAEELPEEPQEENRNIIIDEDGMAGILERLDRIIGLLSPSAADEETEAEELTAAIGEALETSVKEETDPVAGEIAAVMEEVLEPAFSTILEESEDEDEPERQGILPADDALRAALTAVRPVLARIPKKQRNKMAGDIAARLRTGALLRSLDTGAYAALSSARRRPSAATADLGRRIMEKRNANYRR